VDHFVRSDSGVRLAILIGLSIDHIDVVDRGERSLRRDGKYKTQPQRQTQT
jgi:hypothetical protein